MAGQLTITDLDDFLTPSQACIIPVRNGKAQSDLPSGETEIHIDNDNNYYEVSTYATTATLPTNSIAGPGPSTLRNEKKALEKAEINLNDCLACSGCITSTESLLITLQSQTEVLAYITSASSTPRIDTRTPVLSISPQTLASLSAAYAAKRASRPIPLVVLLRRIRHFLSAEERGGWRVWDTTFARHLSLRETVNEFEERRAAVRSGQAGQSGQGGEAGKVGVNGESRINEYGRENGTGRAEIPKAGPLPMLASACPGWVCYAEKAQADLLPLLSNVRSSQAISGALVKQWWATRMGIKPEEIYHVSAMPCYDKKLEASRSDFYSELHQTRDIDCVLTTGELDLLLSELSFNPYAASPLDNTPSTKSASPSYISSLTTSAVPELLQHPGTISGSYLHTLLTHFALSHPSPTSIYTRQIRDSPDNEEYILYDSLTGEPIFKGAKVYGFRNLQNLVRKVGKETGIGKGKGAGRLAAAVAARRRKGKPTAGNGVQTPGTPGTPGIADASANGDGNGHDVGEQLERMRKWDEKKLDFVEVMACPSGCVNGGGQMKPVGEAAKGTEGVEKPCNGSNAQAASSTSSASATGAALPDPGHSEVDAEGYPRPMPDDGVASLPAKPLGPQGAESEEGQGWKWSTKEWVKRVEEVYWQHTGMPSSSADIAAQAKAADEMCEVIVGESCRGDEGKRARWEMLRTRFRKVEGDVLGGEGITLDAVKW